VRRSLCRVHYDGAAAARASTHPLPLIKLASTRLIFPQSNHKQHSSEHVKNSTRHQLKTRRELLQAEDLVLLHAHSLSLSLSSTQGSGSSLVESYNLAEESAFYLQRCPAGKPAWRDFRAQSRSAEERLISVLQANNTQSESVEQQEKDAYISSKSAAQPNRPPSPKAATASSARRNAPQQQHDTARRCRAARGPGRTRWRIAVRGSVGGFGSLLCSAQDIEQRRLLQDCCLLFKRARAQPTS